MAGLSFTETENLLRQALREDHGKDAYIYIQSVYPSSVVYSDSYEDGKPLYRRSYAIADNNKVTLGDKETVLRVVTYEPVSFGSTLFTGEGERLTVAALHSGEEGVPLIDARGPSGPVTIPMFAVQELNPERAPVATFSVSLSKDGTEYSGKVFEAGTYPDKDFEMSEQELASAASSFAPVSLNVEHRKSLFDGKLGTLSAVTVKGKELFGKLSVPKAVAGLIGKGTKVSLEFDRATKRITGCALVLNPRVTDASLVAAMSSENAPDRRKGRGMKIGEWLENLRRKGTITEAEHDKLAVFADESGETKPEEKPAATVTEPKKGDPITARLAHFEAENLANKLQSEGRLIPAQHAEFAAAYRQAVLDDHAGTACFSDGGEFIEGERAKRLREMAEKAPAHRLTGETLPAGSVAVFDSGDKKDEFDRSAIARAIGVREGK